jgi:YD repeat-containing protein
VNNGQIQGITDARGAAFSTSYTYDALGRLSQAPGAPPFVIFERWEPGISTSSMLILKSQGVHVRTSPPNENRVGWGNLVVVVS